MLAYWIVQHRRHQRVRAELFCSPLDLLVLAYVIYGGINWIFMEGQIRDPEFLFRWVFLCLMYLLCRYLPRISNYFLYGIVVAAFIQSAMGLLQIFGVTDSFNSDFPITGFFRNPGHLAAYLTMALVINLGFIAEKAKRKRLLERTGYLLVFSALIITAAMLCCKSRTSIMALFVFFLYLGFSSVYLKSRVNIRRKLLILVSMGLVLISGLLLYKIRSGSADARLLIWKVSSGIFSENPISGTGVTTFKHVYMYAQAEYFSKYPDSNFSVVSNNHYQAFNVFIQIACEQGIIGLILFCTTIGYALVKGRNPIAGVTLVSLVILSSFLYTSDIFPLMVMFPLFLGELRQEDQVIRRIRIGSKGYLIGMGVLVGVWILSYHYYEKYKFAAQALSEFRHLGSEQALQILKKEYDLIRRHRTFSLVYTKQLFEKGVDRGYVISVYKDVAKIHPMSDMIVDLGDLYVAENAYDLAVECYLLADQMVPSRIIPLQKLFNLYLLMENKQGAVSTAEKIISKKVSVFGSIAIKAKSDARCYLQSVLPCD